MSIKNEEIINDFSKEYNSFKTMLTKILFQYKSKQTFNKNLIQIISSLNDKDQLTYLIYFSNYKKWLLPYFNITLSENNSNSRKIYTSPIFIFQLQNNNFINEKIVICWFFYLFYSLSNCKLNLDPNSGNSVKKLNEFRYLLKETNNIIIKLYKSNLIDNSFMFEIIEFFIILIENFAYLYRTSDQIRRVKLYILFDGLFFLINEISINILKKKSEKDISDLVKLLVEIMNNKEINNSYNINILLNTNIIQIYIQNILDHINHLEISKINKEFIKTLSNFYANFLKFNYKISKLSKNCLCSMITAFENLYYFIENQQQIIHDLFIQTFQTELYFKIISKEDHLLTLEQHPLLNDSFLFNGHDSFISLKMNNLDLNGKFLFFSFNLNNKYNQNEYPLVFLQREININSQINYENVFRLFIRNVKDTKNNNVYSLCVSQPQTKNELILLEDSKFTIKTNTNYYCCIFFDEKVIKIFLFNNTFTKSCKQINKRIIKMNFNKNNLILNLGFDLSSITKESQEEHYFCGLMGPVIILKDFSNELKNKINIDEVIEKILHMKENYSNLVFLSKTNNYDVINFFVNKASQREQNNKLNEILNCLNFGNQKYIFNCCLFLIPNIFKLMNYNNVNKNYHIPLIADICNEHKNYIIKKINISLYSYNSSFDEFILNNGFYYICLQFEYFNQIANYYLINKNEKNIMNDFDFIPDILNCINRNLLLLGNNNNELNTSKIYKQIFMTLFNCLINLNKIKPIINDILPPLFILSDVYRSNIFCHIECNKNKYKNIEKNENLIKNSKNFSFFAGIFEILLTKEFFINPVDGGKNYESMKNLFHKLLQALDTNQKKNMVNYYLYSYSNLFNQSLSFGSLLYDLMENYSLDISINENGISTIKNDIEGVNKGAIIFYFELLKLFFKNPENNKEICQKYFNLLFRFIFGNLRYNFTIVCNYLVTFYSLIKNEYKYLIDEEKINQIFDYMNEIEKSDFKNKIKSDKINYKLIKEKIINVLICILFEIFFTKYELKNNLNQLINFINNKTINKDLLLLIKDVADKYFNISFSNNFEKIYKKNNNISNYYWNIFEVIISILRILLSDNIDYNIDSSLPNAKFEEEIKKYKVFLIYNVINILYDLCKKIEHNVIYEEYKENTMFCIINFLKFLDFIIFDQQLKILYTQNLFFTTMKSVFIICEKSCLINSNILINMDEENNCIKSVVEIILDIFVEYTTNISLNYQNKKLSKNTDIEKDLEDLSNTIQNLCILDNKNKKLKEKNKYHFPEFISIFFVNDYMKLSATNKKFLKQDLFNINILNINKSNKEIEILFKNDYKQFDYLFLLFFVVKIHLYIKKINAALPISEKRYGKESLKKYEDIKNNFIRLLKIIIEDYKKLYNLNKDFCYKINTNDDAIFKRTKQFIDEKFYNNFKKILEENEFEEIFNNIESQMQNFIDINILTSGALLNGGVQNKKIKQLSSKKGSLKGSIHSSDKNIIDNISTSNKTPPDESPFDDILIDKENNQNGYFSKTIGETNNKYGNLINDLTPKKNQESKKVKINPVFSLKNINTNYQCFFRKYDSSYLKNPKKELMNNIFSIYFQSTFYENKMFKILKDYYLNLYPQAQESTKILNYPSKIKHYNNGLEPPLFLKNNKNFFITNIFPVTHEYFYNYMKKNNLKSKFISLIPKQVQNIPTLYRNGKDFDINCELLLIDHNIYGHLINSFEGKYMIFVEKKFDYYEKIPKNTGDYFDNIFSMSSVNKKPKTERLSKNPDAKNIFRIKKRKFNKMILILYEEIEEIIIRRFLLMWQGIEIYLKNGKNYFFNLLHTSKCNKIMKIFSENKIGNKITFKIDFETSINKLQKEWQKDGLDTYEYLLYINKYSSRSFNDCNQYLIFPWLLKDYKKLNEINMHQLEIYKYLTQKKSSKNNLNNLENEENTNKEKENEENLKSSRISLLSILSNTITNKSMTSENNITIKSINNKGYNYLKFYRKLKYPVSAQTKENKETLLKRYVEDNSFKFKYHTGTHYSTSAYVYYFLMRNEPFSTLLVKLQNYFQENPNRMFNGIADVTKTLEVGNDNRELLPEFFCKIEFFINLNCAFFGKRSNGDMVDDIYSTVNTDNESILSLKYITKLVNFIIEHRKLLNSESISININEWIDNIFGINQLIKNNKERENSCNVFPKNTYEQNIDLNKKLNKYRSKNYKKGLKPEKIGQMIIDKINLIICFGQTPYQLFKQAHPIKNEKGEEFLIHEERRENERNASKSQESLKNLQNNIINTEENDENKGENFLMGDDDIDSLIINFVRPERVDTNSQVDSIYFEINPLSNKIFILSENREISVIDSKMYNRIGENYYNLKQIAKIQLPYFKFFKKINNEYIKDFYIYKNKYIISSFSEEENVNNKSTYYYNKFLDEIDKRKLNDEEKSDKNNSNKKFIRFISCRYLDNSFKIFFIYNNKKPEDNKKKKNKNKPKDELKDYKYLSFICEDFVTACCTIDSNTFIIGLKNGKLIKASLLEKQNEKFDEINIENNYYIKLKKYIQGHKDGINLIEIDQRLGIVITGGDDNYIYIRKLYDFELLTPIKIKKKYIITMAKVSPMNFLYVLCYNKKKENMNTIIFGYTLSGLKFAKSEYAYYSSFDFTKNGNIITLINKQKIAILNGSSLKNINISENDSDYNEFNKINNDIKGALWMQYDYFVRKASNNKCKIISYLANNFKFHSIYVDNIKCFD